MKRVLQWALLGVAVWFLMLSGCNKAYIAQSNGPVCTRESLETITDKFFIALEAHKPSSAPLATDVKYTENSIAVSIGKGVWETAGKTIFKRGMVDTQKCGTHTQAIMEEKGQSKPMLYGVRLKVDKGRISEIEAIVVRGKQVLDVPAILATKDQDWEGILPPEQRSSRLSMIAAADDYFELFVKDKENKPRVSELPYSGFCDRWENGLQTTKGGVNQGVEMPAHNCSPVGFADMTHSPRRFLVDVETGIVVAYTLFNNIWPDFHMFKMRNGRVEWIQAYFEYSKKYESIGWPDEPLGE